MVAAGELCLLHYCHTISCGFSLFVNRLVIRSVFCFQKNSFFIFIFCVSGLIGDALGTIELQTDTRKQQQSSVAQKALMHKE